MDLSEQLLQLKKLLVEKDSEIDNLKLKMVELETNTIFNQSDSDLESTTTTSEVENIIQEAFKAQESDNSDEDSSIDEEEIYSCDICDFKTKHGRGLKVHIGRVHSLKCEMCQEQFLAKESFKRHKDLEVLLENICDKKEESLCLEMRKFRTDESCLGVFSPKEPREDDLPLLFLHTFECWNRSGHVCCDLPLDAFENQDQEKDFVQDYDFYNPTKHSMLEWVVMGDINLKGSYPDWTRVDLMIKKQ